MIEKGPTRAEVPLPSILQERWEGVFWRAASAQTASEKHPAHSEDVVEVNRNLGFFTVCDGMGGYEHGTEAASIATRALHDTVASWDQDLDDDEVVHLLPDSIRNALRNAHDAMVVHGAGREMDTTATVMQVRQLTSGERIAVVGHVGDCRAYLVSQLGEVTQITEDDDLMSTSEGARLVLGKDVPDAELPERIRAVREEVESAPDASSLSAEAQILFTYRMMSMGVGSAKMIPHVYVVRFPKGSRIAMMSDGVYENLGRAGTGAALSENSVPPPQQALAMVTKAQKSGHDKKLPTSKRDDISAVIIEST